MRWLCIALFLFTLLGAPAAFGDGVLVPPYEAPEYEGTLQERSQEAVIIYNEGVEDLVIKVSYDGDPADFAWVVPFPSEPEIYPAHAELFEELFNYVNYRLWEEEQPLIDLHLGFHKQAEGGRGSVRVLSERVVGSYETTVLEATAPGGLNAWLGQNGYRVLPEEIVEFYRENGWVFAAIKVHEAAGSGERVLHPLRFRFRPDKEDAMVYPMKISGYQDEPMDVNIYVFYESWVNVDADEHGALAKGFLARYKEGWCDKWSVLQLDEEPLQRVRQLFLNTQPNEFFYLTNIYQRQLKPADIRSWADDLYIYPHYETLASWWEDWGGLVIVAVVVVGLAVTYWLIRRHR
jgi:hypothetical protein